jgi:hypothetical protein
MVEEMVVVIGAKGGGLGERSGDAESRPLEPEVDSGLAAGESEMVKTSVSASAEEWLSQRSVAPFEMHSSLPEASV